MIPVCKPIIAVLLLYQFVAQWNSYFDAMIYLDDTKLQPLQLVIRSILIQNTPRPGMIADVQSAAAMAKMAQLLKILHYCCFKFTFTSYVSIFPKVF